MKATEWEFTNRALMFGLIFGLAAGLVLFWVLSLVRQKKSNTQA
jgi:hypothetical protein